MGGGARVLIASVQLDNATYDVRSDAVELELVTMGVRSCRSGKVADMAHIRALAAGKAHAARPGGEARPASAAAAAPRSSAARRARTPEEQAQAVERLFSSARAREARAASAASCDRPVYLRGKGAWSQPSGGRFNLSNPKSWIEWNVYLNKGIPGPATYSDAQLRTPTPSGGRFGNAKPPSMLDLAILNARHTPGPGGNGPLPTCLSTAGVGKIQVARGKTFVDWEVLRAERLPAPGQYDVPQTVLPAGGRFGKHNPKSQLDLAILRAKGVPGPSDYHPEFSYTKAG
jgi:hypothetical protein